ncbi:RNA polymerase II subunit A C-terminal domain phosphatase [Diutina catenulata]
MTHIRLPSSVKYPVTITQLSLKPGQSVTKHEPVLKYKYWDTQEELTDAQGPSTANPVKDEVRKKEIVQRIGTLESPVEGNLTRYMVAVGETIHEPGAAAEIHEACAHTVQYGGLCALCGQSVDNKDYSGYDYSERANIAMSHDNTGLKISRDEAERIEQSANDRLVQEKKLILVVDLDQTVIHATVDPTVGEWQSDPSNPNYPAIKDVQKFCLAEEPVMPPGWTGPKMAPTKCWYYVKVRPGLQQFLQSVNTKYEMHIYTMATRNYALAIAKIIDPDGKYFGDRILSRDESGSLTHKNLKRLFPVNQSMVVIIDDRGDVWQWEANLIKVVPYDFFVGIGDINSSFLPKKSGQLTGPTKKRNKVIAQLAEEEEAAEEESRDSSTEHESDSEAFHASISKQQHDRPLAKLQENLEKLHDQPSSDIEDDELLYDDDNELPQLEKVLVNIHDQYYHDLAKFDAKPESQRGPRPDLAHVIPRMKESVLSGLVVLFTGIIPTMVPLDQADIVIWARQFGVRVVNEVYPDVTHVVCRDPGQGPGPTFKARVAKKILPKAKLVNPDWLFACLSQWKKVAEDDYLVSTGNDGDWVVNEGDISRYKKSITFDINIDDLAGADQELDEFLQGSSDEDDDDNEDDEDEGALNSNGKRRREDDDEDQSRNPNGKRAATAPDDGELDDLEAELLEGFDEIEE